MLKLQFVDYRQAPVWAMERSFSIGRNLTNQLPIDSELISDLHAKILQNENSFVLKDMGSRTGTYVNGEKITQANIACGDILRFGDVELRILNPFTEKGGHSCPDSDTEHWSLIADSSWLSGQEFPLPFSSNQKTLSIGRSSHCDLTLAGTHLSKSHAEITLPKESDAEKNHQKGKPPYLLIRDLESTNGSFINGRKITKAKVRAGDQLRFDVFSFRVFGPGIKLPSSSSQVKTLEENNPVFAEETQAKSKKFWKTRPTSPGNRQEQNHYKRSWASLFVASGLGLLLVIFSVYLIWAIM